MAVTSNLDPTGNCLETFGDANKQHHHHQPQYGPEQILVNGGAVSVDERNPATVANTTEIDVFGQDGGGHLITLDEFNGALPFAHLFGGAGNDVHDRWFRRRSALRRRRQ